MGGMIGSGVLSSVCDRVGNQSHGQAGARFAGNNERLLLALNSSIMGLLGSYPHEMLVALFLGYLLFRQCQWKQGRNSNPKGLPLPPGPKGYPLIGNLFDLPVISRPSSWLVYTFLRRLLVTPDNLNFLHHSQQ
jgi:hypothetical protein